MKNIICPISSERIPSHLPRLNAFYTILLLLTFIVTGFLPLLIFLSIDFLARALNQSTYSLLFWLSKGTAYTLTINSSLIDKAPKLFAARMGFFMTLLALIAEIAGAHGITITIISMIAVFSFMECVLNFCVACYVYTFLVLPLYAKH